jgi:hypothetical protein
VRRSWPLILAFAAATAACRDFDALLETEDLSAAFDGGFDLTRTTGDGGAGCGDCNGDGNVDSMDVSYLGKHLAGGPSPVGDCDVDGDGVVDGDDVGYLSDHVVSDGPPPMCR